MGGVPVSGFDEETMQALRLFGGQLKHWRGLRGWTQEEFARRVGYSCELVASIEQGRRVARPPFCQQADDALNARGAIKVAGAHINTMVKRAAIVGELPDVEGQAVCLDFFDPMAIPAVLRTEEYARAVVSGFCPTPDDGELDLLVADDLARGAVLDRRPSARIGFVIEESVLRRPLGGRGVLGDQLGRVAEIARRGNVTLQVLPMDCEEHAGLSGSIALLETSERHQVAHIEHAGGGQWITSPKDVSVLYQRYGIIRAQAMTTRDSLDLIEKLAADHGAVGTG